MKLFVRSTALAGIVPDAKAKEFHLVRMNLTAAACPQPYASRVPNQAAHMPIVVVKNGHNAGHVQATGYTPHAVVAAGEQRRRSLLARGIVSSWVWAEAGMEIQADDAISCESLISKLQAELNQKLSPAVKALSEGLCGPCAWICQTYPFENYFIYSFQGDKFRQGYDLDPIKQEVKLDGTPTKVQEKFVDAAGMDNYAFPDTGLRKTPSVSRPYALGIMPPAPDAELLTQIVRDYSNIKEAADAYVAATKTGLYKQMTPVFQPVKLGPDNHPITQLVQAGIAPADFACWSCSPEAKSYKLWARQFSDKKRAKLAKTGVAMKDGSYPIQTVGDLKNAVKAFGRSPDQATKAHIVKRAKALGATHMLPDKWNVSATASPKCCKCDATLNENNQFVNAGGKKMNYCKACYGKMDSASATCKKCGGTNINDKGVCRDCGGHVSAAAHKCIKCGTAITTGKYCESCSGPGIKAAGRIAKTKIQNHMHGLMRGSDYSHKKTNPDGTRVYAHKSNGRTLTIGPEGDFHVMNSAGKVLRTGKGAGKLRHHLTAGLRAKKIKAAWKMLQGTNSTIIVNA